MKRQAWAAPTAPAYRVCQTNQAPSDVRAPSRRPGRASARRLPTPGNGRRLGGVQSRRLGRSENRARPQVRRQRCTAARLAAGQVATDRSSRGDVERWTGQFSLVTSTLASAHRSRSGTLLPQCPQGRLWQYDRTLHRNIEAAVSLPMDARAQRNSRTIAAWFGASYMALYLPRFRPSPSTRSSRPWGERT
jgi:hypothetical protein